MYNEQEEKLRQMQNAQCVAPEVPYPTDCVRGIGGAAEGTIRRATLREEAEKNVHYHYEQAQKASEAASFLRENPAFDEFIRLVRSGAIQF